MTGVRSKEPRIGPGPWAGRAPGNAGSHNRVARGQRDRRYRCGPAWPFAPKRVPGRESTRSATRCFKAACEHPVPNTRPQSRGRRCSTPRYPALRPPRCPRGPRGPRGSGKRSCLALGARDPRRADARVWGLATARASGSSAVCRIGRAARGGPNRSPYRNVTRQTETDAGDRAVCCLTRSPTRVGSQAGMGCRRVRATTPGR
jgi:hypothetical protein